MNEVRIADDDMCSCRSPKTACFPLTSMALILFTFSVLKKFCLSTNFNMSIVFFFFFVYASLYSSCQFILALIKFFSSFLLSFHFLSEVSFDLIDILFELSIFILFIFLFCTFFVSPWVLVERPVRLCSCIPLRRLRPSDKLIIFVQSVA